MNKLNKMHVNEVSKMSTKDTITVNVDIPVHVNYIVSPSNKVFKGIRRRKPMTSSKKGESFSINVDLLLSRIGDSFFLLDQRFLEKFYIKVLKESVFNVFKGDEKLRNVNISHTKKTLQDIDSSYSDVELENIHFNGTKKLKIENYNMKLPSTITVNVYDVTGRKYKIFSLTKNESES